MLVLKSYEDVFKIAKQKRNVLVDIGDLNYLDYTKVIDYIKGLKGAIKKITRSKFIFFYE